MNAAQYVRRTIAALQSDGKTVREIAALLGVSSSTVSDYTTTKRNAAGEEVFPDPKTSVFEKCIRIAGGNLDRALPDYSPQADIDRATAAELRDLREHLRDLENRLATIHRLSNAQQPPAHRVHNVHETAAERPPRYILNDHPEEHTK